MGLRRILLALLLLPACALAQNTRWDSIATTTQGSGAAVPLLALPGAGVTIYSYPAMTLASTYNSATATMPCPSGAQVVLQGRASCSSSADFQGNFGAWFLPGQYVYYLRTGTQSLGPYNFTISISGSSGGGLSGQTPGYVPLATSATASTVSSHLGDNGTSTFSTLPFTATAFTTAGLTSSATNLATPVQANCTLGGFEFDTVCNSSFYLMNDWPLAPGEGTGGRLDTILGSGEGGAAYSGTSKVQSEGRYDHGVNESELFNQAGGAQDLRRQEKDGVGDFLGEYWTWYNSAGCAYSSDQCSQGLFMTGGEQLGFPINTVATGGTGATSPTFTGNWGGCSFSFCFPAPGTWLMDLTQAAETGVVTAGSSTFSEASWIVSIPVTAAGLPLLTARGYSTAGINPTPVTLKTPAPVTVTLTSGTGAFSTGVACLAGTNFIEQVNITSATGSAGTQTLAFLSRHPQTQLGIFQGTAGSTCRDLSFDNYHTLTGAYNSYVAIGMLDSTHLLATSEGFSGVGADRLPNVGIDPVSTDGSPTAGFHLFCAARITNSDAYYQSHSSYPVAWQDLSLEPNGCSWAPSDTVADTHFDVQEQQGMVLITNQSTPAVQPGLGIEVDFTGMGMQRPFDVEDSTPLNWFSGYGGLLNPKQCAYCIGGHQGLTYFGSSLYTQNSPLTSLITVGAMTAGQTSMGILHDQWGDINQSSGLFTFSNAYLDVPEGGISALGQISGSDFYIPFGGGIEALGITNSAGGTSWLGLCNTGSSDTDLCVFSGARSGGIVTPNLTLRGLTQAINDNSTKMATTAYVDSVVLASTNFGALLGTASLAPGACVNYNTSALPGVTSSSLISLSLSGPTTDVLTAAADLEWTTYYDTGVSEAGYTFCNRTSSTTWTNPGTLTLNIGRIH